MNHTGLTRRTALAALTSAVATITTGCGGGGSDGDVATPPPPPPTAPVEPGPVTSVPPAIYEDENRTSAFDRLNAVRRQAGLGLLAQQADLDRSAQAHSAYQAAEGVSGHEETPGRPNFTGQFVRARAQAANYSPERIGEGVVSWPEFSQASDLIDILMGGPYHRLGLLLFHTRDLGIGLIRPNSLSKFMTIVFGNKLGQRQGNPGNKFIVWPPENAIDVPISMASESPDPIPENQGSPGGYSASIHVNDIYRSISVKSFEIFKSNGEPVVSKLISWDTDSNLRSFGSAGRSMVALLPISPLDPNSRYTAKFSGDVYSVTGGKELDIAMAWSFTTGTGKFF